MRWTFTTASRLSLLSSHLRPTTARLYTLTAMMSLGSIPPLFPGISLKDIPKSSTFTDRLPRMSPTCRVAFANPRHSGPNVSNPTGLRRSRSL